MKLLPMAGLVIAAGFFFAPAVAQQPSPKPAEHEHATPAPQAGAPMSHDTMMAQMKAADARLEAMVQTMKSARGDDKVSAIQALLTEIVHHQAEMHRQMATMHEHMMSKTPHK
jgi:hypothetical protein